MTAASCRAAKVAVEIQHQWVQQLHAILVDHIVDHYDYDQERGTMSACLEAFENERIDAIRELEARKRYLRRKEAQLERL